MARRSLVLICSVLGVLVGAAAGHVLSGHREVITVQRDTFNGFTTDHYTCWQTTTFQLCDVLPSRLPRVHLDTTGGIR